MKKLLITIGDTKAILAPKIIIKRNNFKDIIEL